MEIILPGRYVVNANQKGDLSVPNSGIVLLNPILEVCRDGRIILHPRDENDVVVQLFLTCVVPDLSGKPVSIGRGLGRRNPKTNIAEPVSEEEYELLMKSGQVWEFNRPASFSGNISPIVQSAPIGYAGDVSVVGTGSGSWMVIGVPLGSQIPTLQPERMEEPLALEGGHQVKALLTDSNPKNAILPSISKPESAQGTSHQPSTCPPGQK